jgi:ubiquitin-protein ligase
MVKEGFYEGGIFRFLIEFPSGFPFEAPQITFKGPIFSSIVDSQGRLDFKVRLKEAFSRLEMGTGRVSFGHDWKNQVHFLR